MKPTCDDFIAARKLIASVLDAPPADAQTAAVYHHDHDEELGIYWYTDPLVKGGRQTSGVSQHLVDLHRPRPRDNAYWTETADLLMEYFELQAGDDDSETLLGGFIDWTERSPGALKQYNEGDDMARAALVDWYLRLVR